MLVYCLSAVPSVKGKTKQVKRMIRAKLIVGRIFGVACIFAYLSLTAVSSVHAETTYQSERMWPTLAGPWYFGLPLSLSATEEGSLIVSEVDPIAWTHFSVC